MRSPPPWRRGRQAGADAAKAVELTGAIQNEGIVERIEKARALGLPVVADSKTLTHPQFENARVRTPLLLRAEAGNPPSARNGSARSPSWSPPIPPPTASRSRATA